MGQGASVAIVTGGASGIGRATALAFAQQGTRVLVADVLEKEGAEVVRAIEQAGGHALFVRCDVSDDAQVKRMVETCVDRLGGLDFAFNNAGVEGVSASTSECTAENWDRVIDINLKGTWLCMKHELAYMVPRKSGVIVNCSSIAGVVGFAQSPAYVASKHGVIGLTKTAALEVATLGIRVNVICPGVIETPMIERFTGNNPEVHAQLAAFAPMARVGQPEEIASAVLWLCSPGAAFTTGTSLVIDGGMVAR